MYKVISFKKNRKNYEVIIMDETNKETKYSVSEDLIVDFRLVRKKILSEIEFLAFVNATHKDKIYQKVLYFATYKQRSEKEVKTYLTKKQVLEIDQLYYIDKLRKVSILNDDSYTKNYVFEAFNYKLLGPRKIIRDLKLKGIEKGMYEPYISELKHDDIIKNIETLFYKKYRGYKNCSLKKAVASIKTFLANKGYNFIDVDLVINRNFSILSENVNEKQAIKRDYEIIAKNYERKQPKQNKKQYIITKLLAKGYEYSEIKKLI